MTPPLPHPRALAYLGDAVFSLWVREWALTQSDVLDTLHQLTQACVRAEQQAALLETVTPTLTETEQDWVRRGRNITLSNTKRANQAIHRQATAFETLIGAWFLTLDPRALELKKQQVMTALQTARQTQNDA